MRVLVIFSYKYSFKTWKETGNIDRELQLYKSLKNNDNIEFTFFTYGDPSDREILDEFGKFDLITYFDIFKSYKNLLIKSILAPFFLRKYSDNFDIIKCIQLNGSWVGIILKILTKKPLYIKTGFDQFIFSIKEKKSFLKRILFYLLTQLGLMNSNLYTVASKHDVSFINKYYYFFNSKKLKLRPNWVEIIEDKKVKNKYEKKVIAIGRLSDQKNYSFIIKSLENSDITLEILGSGELLNQLKNEAYQKKVNVKFLGNLRNKEVIEKLKESRYFIIASKYEGNPKVVLEAMSSGCVVIASSIPNNTEIIKDGVTGFVFSIDEEESNILKIINKSEELKLYESISENAKEFIKKNNSLELFTSQEVDDYKYILNNN